MRKAFFLITCIVLIVLIIFSLYFFRGDSDEKLKSSNFSDSNVQIVLNIEPEFLKVDSGTELFYQADVIKSGNSSLEDMVFKAFLENGEEQIFLNKKTAAVGLEASLVFKSVIPENTKSGDYLLVLRMYDAKEENLIGEASKNIHVK